MRLAFFGGTFNPFHLGHLKILTEVKKLLSYDKIFVVPNQHPPHKKLDNTTSYEHRCEIIKLTIKGLSFCEVKRLEEGEDKTFYTIDTIKFIYHNYFINGKIGLVLGLDSFLSLSHWHKAQELLTLVEPIIINRPHYNHSIDMGNFPIINLQEDISSSFIREEIYYNRENSLYKFLSNEVIEYIKYFNLYKC